MAKTIFGAHTSSMSFRSVDDVIIDMAKVTRIVRCGEQLVYYFTNDCVKIEYPDAIAASKALAYIEDKYNMFNPEEIHQD